MREWIGVLATLIVTAVGVVGCLYLIEVGVEHDRKKCEAAGGVLKAVGEDYVCFAKGVVL